MNETNEIQIDKEIEISEVEILKYLSNLEQRKIVDKVYVKVKSNKDVDVVVKVGPGKITSGLVKIESDIYCKPKLNVDSVFRNLNTLRVLNKQGHTYFITVTDSDGD